MDSAQQSTSAVEPMRCARCDCTFKRLEHLRRHERIHDNNKRYACRYCSKRFTRSDILRRHEATHTAPTQASNLHTVSTRACTECAKSRERCTKSSPCQRCLTKGLRCAYPLARISTRNDALSCETRPNLQISAEPHQHADAGINISMDVTSRPVRESGALLGPEFANEHDTHTPYQEPIPFGMPNYSQGQMLPPVMDFPINWLPPDPSLAIDYDSIVGLGVGSIDFFTLPNLSPDDNSVQGNIAHASTAVQPSAEQQQGDDAVRRNMRMPLAGNPETPWSNHYPEATESHASSSSPYSAAHTISPSDAPGGLYATSINGARMPCTIRARRDRSVLPGAKPIRRLGLLRHGIPHEPSQKLFFSETSHVIVEDQVATGNGSTYAVPVLSDSTYGDMLQGFRGLCLEEDFGFPPYASSHFPAVPSLNLCLRLYFENFDQIMPILHDQVTQINDHWILALAVSAIGCQYAESDEYAQMVEPMHEFLRRAITVTTNSKATATIDQHQKHEIAFAQARTLSQVGMLYSGSPKLLTLAKAQHSAMVELARHLLFPATPTTLSAFQGDEGRDRSSLVLENILYDECKRRIGYAIWLLDCMAVYHFGQQLFMPPSMMSTPLPDDRLWHAGNAADSLMRPTSSKQCIPSLSSATVMLFQEKKVAAELGQFSRVILLHSVYREIFQLKDCFARPFGSWVPSVQQHNSENGVESPTSPAISDRGGRSLLHSWRNAGLDCVDVLHWAANGTIALQAGAEHPTVLHLHLSRTIILTPFDQFQTLANSVISFAQKSTPATLDLSRRQAAIDAERDILEWAQRDQCKARLAVLHSGCLFWHIRRYSCRAFYEPMAVFLATLTIWAYSSYVSRTAGVTQVASDRANNSFDKVSASQPFRENDLDNEDAAHSQSDEETEQAPTFIHLDRPNDDEMVQAFVRFGTASAIRANIAGVGDIYSVKGPAKILKEGRKILTKVSTAWGRTDRYFSTLEVLEQVTSGCLALDLERS
ncbi:hypothetical protein SVAN01_00654 [Stagonosporopsis vannaccii]|nr:hypothetical protein SVAN01_00654 [Stagonosporopsis vannaccii]